MNDIRPPTTIAVLGASGLIGEALCARLSAAGHLVVPVARRFTASQRANYRLRAVTSPLVDLDPSGLRAVLATAGADLVVNCIGVLQDAPGSAADDVHTGFVARLVGAIAALDRDTLLVHVSIPGSPEDDATAFARSKRAAEEVIASSSASYAILRPGFVVAEAAYGGSALLRALAMWPVSPPEDVARRPFAVTDMEDIARTVSFLAGEWQKERRVWRVSWDVMESEASSVGTVLNGLRERLGGPAPRLAMPEWLLKVGSRAGDLASRLGWRPPVRTTALAEMRRGVRGDPRAWTQATGIVPRSGTDVVRSISSTVQERWFACLYLLKALALGTLCVFWIVSGLIALTVAFEPATRILTDHGFGEGLAKAITVATSLLDISIGVLIANRRTCRLGLLGGIAVSLFYMVSAAVITPDMWIEPLGALVKTGPAIILMMVGLATLDDR